MSTVPSVTKVAVGNVTSVKRTTSTMMQSRNAVSETGLLFSSFPEFLLFSFFHSKVLTITVNHLSSHSQQLVPYSPSIPNKSLTYQG